MKHLPWIIGIVYFYILFFFIPNYTRKSGKPVPDNYYSGAIKEFVIYLVAYAVYTYAYDWLEGFFIR